MSQWITQLRKGIIEYAILLLLEERTILTWKISREWNIDNECCISPCFIL